MGLAPAGRCNDFARGLGVGTDPVDIASTLADGEPRAIDLGRLNGRYFCTVATLGVDAEVSSYVDTMRMPLRGTAAYVYGALRVLARYRANHVRITGDFGVIEQAVFLASSANTASYGGAIPIAPDASPLDGELDLCVIDRVTRLRAFALLPIVMMGRHTSRPGVRFIRAKRFNISATEPKETGRRGSRARSTTGTVDAGPALEIWADGERIGSTPADVEVVPGAIRVLLPR
jgi:diacylglycerol kinase (ATP)